MISVVIATRNRPEKIGNCLKSILANNFSDYEIVIINQSDDSQTKEILSRFRRTRINYFKTSAKGLNQGRNFRIKEKGA